MTITIDGWRARWIIEALRNLDVGWQAALDATDDEDLHADLGMDLVKLHMVREDFEAEAVLSFGEGITSFSAAQLELAK